MFWLLPAANSLEMKGGYGGENTAGISLHGE
jgi:hypothetical protein